MVLFPAPGMPMKVKFITASYVWLYLKCTINFKNHSPILPQMNLDWNKIQQKWQKQWEKAELGKATAHKGKDKFFMVFAYPGISGFLHIGHMRGFSYSD